MTNDQLLKDIHEAVGKTNKTVGILDERSRVATGQIKTIQDDVKDIQATTVKLEERSRGVKENMKDLKADARRMGGVSGVAATGGAGGLLWLLYKLRDWWGSTP